MEERTKKKKSKIKRKRVRERERFKDLKRRTHLTVKEGHGLLVRVGQTEFKVIHERAQHRDDEQAGRGRK